MDRKLVRMFCLVAWLGMWASWAPGAAPAPAKPLPAPLGIRLGDWGLPRAGGPVWSIAKDAKQARVVVVVFLGAECPINNLYLPTLSAMHETYGPRGVRFVGINSNEQDDASAVARHARKHRLPFVMLKDEGARIADRFAAARTPEVFVLDGTRTVRYRGRIDDRYDKGVQRPEAVRRDLIAAIDAVLAGREVPHPVTEPAGCLIGRPVRPSASGKAKVTWCKDVAPLVQKHCQGCHRPGEAAPFSLRTYKDAAAWSGAIHEAVAERRMPPWHLDPAVGAFRNCRRLSDAQRGAVLAWIDQGCPEGDPADLPPPRHFVPGWSIGKPDAVFTMPVAVPIPAHGPRGGIPYKFVLVSAPFAEEKWVRCVECRAGTPSVVHHITAFLLPPGTDLSRWKQKSEWEMLLTSYADDSFLGGSGPGENPLVLPPGQAKRIPKGASIAFELHYTPNGTACSDRSSVGLVYAKERPRHQVLSGVVMQVAFMIPPRASNHQVTASKTFDRPAKLLSLCPHMHLRGKDFSWYLVRPDNSRELLLRLPRWDFNWQTNYLLKEPVSIPKGGRLECVAHYDNSSANPNNPDPKKWVFWGEQSWNEMMNGFFDYYLDSETDAKVAGR
jgi:hypothetical protein